MKRYMTNENDEFKLVFDTYNTLEDIREPISDSYLEDIGESISAREYRCYKCRWLDMILKYICPNDVYSSLINLRHDGYPQKWCRDRTIDSIKCCSNDVRTSMKLQCENFLNIEKDIDKTFDHNCQSEDVLTEITVRYMWMCFNLFNIKPGHSSKHIEMDEEYVIKLKGVKYDAIDNMLPKPGHIDTQSQDKILSYYIERGSGESSVMFEQIRKIYIDNI